MSQDPPLPAGVRDAPRPPAPLAEDYAALRDAMMGAIPHVQAIGMTMEAIWASNAVVRVPFDARLVGNPQTGVIHGGVITTILDNVSGMAVFAAMDRLTNTATLDLRIDYMRPATPEQPIYAHAHCIKRTRTIAFVHGTAYNLDGDDPIATSTGAFMLG